MAFHIPNGFAAVSEGADLFITEDVIATGAVHWVHSGTGNDSNPGTEGEPLATLGQAITNATANNGDVIIIKSGHSETRTSAITVSKAGLKIFGIGDGSSAPSFTCNAAIDCITVTGNDVELNNLYFPAGTTATNTARINIDARGVAVKGCTFRCGQYDDDSITITANGIDARVESCTFTVTANGPDTGVKVESASATGLHIKDCAFNGEDLYWDEGAIYSNVAHLNFKYDTITLTEGANIVHANSGAKGVISNIIADDSAAVGV